MNFYDPGPVGPNGPTRLGVEISGDGNCYVRVGDGRPYLVSLAGLRMYAVLLTTTAEEAMQQARWKQGRCEAIEKARALHDEDTDP
jgi:hypothetical protein